MEFRLTIRTTSDEVESNPQKWLPQILNDIVAVEIRKSWGQSGSYHDAHITVDWEFEDAEPDPADDVRRMMDRD